MKQFTVIVALLLACISLGQGLPPGGPYDANPWNPANWNTSYATEYDGEDVRVCWENDPVLGPVERTYTRDWATNPAAWPEGAYNSTGLSKTVRYVSSGKTKIKIKWISPFPPPSKVLVEVTSSADYYYILSGSGTASNGLGSSTIQIPLSPMNQGVAQGSKLRYVSIGANGEGTIELEKSAFAESTGVGSWAGGHAQGFTVAIAERAVEIGQWVAPTFRYGLDALPEQNVEDDPTDRVMDVAAISADWEDANALFNTGGLLTAGLWGPWSVNTSVTWTNGANVLFIFPLYSYSWEQIIGLAQSGPDIKNVTATAEDMNDGVSRTGKLKIRIHSPAENVTQTSRERVWGSWVRASHEVMVRPDEANKTLSTFLQVAASVTKSVTTEAGAELAVTVKIVSFKVSGKRQWTTADTALISRTVSTTHTLTAGAFPRVYWVERRAYWQEEWGYYHIYWIDGYRGVGVYTFTDWESGSKQAAESTDFRDELFWYEEEGEE